MAQCVIHGQFDQSSSIHALLLCCDSTMARFFCVADRPGRVQRLSSHLRQWARLERAAAESAQLALVPAIGAVRSYRCSPCRVGVCACCR
eukprot:6208567-Pleurochrysis_carterae.AAC.2